MREKGSLERFVKHLDELAAQRGMEEDASDGSCLRIMTIYRAKGLQWETVVVPDCNEGTIPHPSNGDNVEEERRLFYVAVTRSKRDLYLHRLRDAALTPFLSEVDAQRTIDGVRELRAILDKEPSKIAPAEQRRAVELIREHDLASFFSAWWRPGAEAFDEYMRHAPELAEMAESMFA